MSRLTISGQGDSDSWVWQYGRMRPDGQFRVVFYTQEVIDTIVAGLGDRAEGHIESEKSQAVAMIDRWAEGLPEGVM